MQVPYQLWRLPFQRLQLGHWSLYAIVQSRRRHLVSRWRDHLVQPRRCLCGHGNAAGRRTNVQHQDDLFELPHHHQVVGREFL
jgi:hypothetical protein